MPFISKTPQPPYTAMFMRLMEKAQSHPGYLGIEPARNKDGSGVAVVYFADTESIAAWARDADHREAKRRGREEWYSHYMIRICRVEREYGQPDR